MFRSVLEYVDDLQNTVNDTKESLYKLYGARRRLNNSINKAQEEVALFDNPVRYVASLEPQIRYDVINLSKSILYSKALEAARVNKEFFRSVYLDALADSINDNDTYRVVFKGSGWNKKVEIDIDLNRTAGRLTDWGNAIKLYRKKLGVKIPRANSKLRSIADIRASKYWEDIYNTKFSIFNETIRGRLEYSSKIAPFWEILDKGQPSRMTSDRGGYPPTPSNTKTNFVDIAKSSINSELRNYIKRSKAHYEEVINNVKKEIVELNARLLKIDNLIYSIRFDVKLSNEVKKQFGDLSRYIDDKKLLKAVQLAKKGLSGRVDIGIGGKRIRPTYEKIRSLF